MFFKLNDHMVGIALGSAGLIVAGLCFYLQRSKLAYCYGTICIVYTHPDRVGYVWRPDRRLDEVDSWDTWLRYRNGFTFLMISAVLYSFAICRASGWEGCYIIPLEWVIVAAIVI